MSTVLSNLLPTVFLKFSSHDDKYSVKQSTISTEPSNLSELFSVNLSDDNPQSTKLNMTLIFLM